MARALFLLHAEPDILLERIARLSRTQHGFRLAVLAAACLHAALVSVLSDAQSPPEATWSLPTTELVVELPQSPPPPDESAREASPEPDLQPTSARVLRPSTAIAQAREPARAAAALTQTDASEQPLDLTDSIVIGSAASYAGGVTSAQGSGLRSPGGTGAAPSPSRTPNTNAGSGSLPDRSRAPSVLGGLAWNCPFPPAADVDGVDRAEVTLRLEVDASGHPTRALVLSDPGHGFAGAARNCALGKHWSPGADRWGRPCASGLNLNVRFVR